MKKSNYASVLYTCYELSKNNVLGVTYEESKGPEALDRSTPESHSIEILKLTLNNDDVTEKLEGIWEEIIEHIANENN